MSYRRAFIPRCVFLIPASVFLTFAQVPSGSLSGTVFDESEAVIRDAKVTAVNQETGLQRSVTTGGDGMFLVVGLPPGSYEIRAEAKGFRTLAQEIARIVVES
jgi:Carboxypeptidase regulatory-like domain